MILCSIVSFYFCFTIYIVNFYSTSFGPAGYESEEHRITLRYDGKEVEEDLNAYCCDDGDFEQVWYMYDADD